MNDYLVIQMKLIKYNNKNYYYYYYCHCHCHCHCHSYYREIYLYFLWFVYWLRKLIVLFSTVFTSIEGDKYLDCNCSLDKYGVFKSLVVYP